jgi:hypothetical protein
LIAPVALGELGVLGVVGAPPIPPHKGREGVLSGSLCLCCLGG